MMGLKYYFQVFKDDRWQRQDLSQWPDLANLAERQMYVDEVYAATRPELPMRIINQMGKVAYILEPDKPNPDNDIVQSALDDDDEPRIDKSKVFLCVVFVLFVFVMGYALGRVHLTRSLRRYVNEGQRNELVQDFEEIMQPHFEKYGS